MKPENLKTKIFLDSGDPDETKQALQCLGFLDGQTTNPSLVAKNPDIAGKKFTKKELFAFYKDIVQEISGLIPQGSVSIEVYADDITSKEDMLEQGREMFMWIPNAHIKYPTTAQGLEAAKQSIAEGLRVNMTLVFSQEQAAAVYAATLRLSASSANRSGQEQGSLHGFKDVFVSPFIGRLDDIGENGMHLIENILRMYKKGDGHVEVLTASLRSNNHFMAALQLGSDIITSPWGALKEWGEAGMQLPDSNFVYTPEDLQSIAYKDINLEQGWQNLDISHELTDKGIDRFTEDWNKLLK